MIPILYAPTETEFSSNGIGHMTDAKSCRVRQELNGIYELTMQYPLKGRYADKIKDRSIILAKADPVSELQPFRVYRIQPASSGMIKISARHLAYDLRQIVAVPFTAGSAAETMEILPTKASTECPFTFETDKGTAGTMVNAVPRDIWHTLGGSEGSILDTYHGEYEFDRYRVKLHERRGEDKGLEVRYGKNLSTLEMDRSCAAVATGVYPYWQGPDGTLVELPQKIIRSDGNYNFESIRTLDLSAEWMEPPTPEQLEEKTRSWMKDHQFGVPKISWKVSFVQLAQTVEFRHRALLERALLGDTVKVIFPDMGVDAASRVVAFEYDTILERYIDLTLGSVRSNLADTIVQQGSEIGRKPDTQQVETLTHQISGELGKAMLGASGGRVRLLDTDGDGYPDELYIANQADPATAQKIWRWNYLGWAASAQGYNGPWKMGATLEDGILADWITAAHLTAGTIRSKDGSCVFDLDAGGGKIGNLILRALDQANNRGGYLQIESPTGESTFIGIPNKSLFDKYVLMSGASTETETDYPFRLTAKGEVIATAGKIGGWKIDGSSIFNQNETQNLVLSVNGGLYGGIGDKEWHIRQDGSTLFSSAEIHGEIHAKSGAIGGWKIDGSSIFNQNETQNLVLSVNGGLYGGVEGKEWHIRQDGSTLFNSAEIHGNIYAENGYFRGSVYANKISYGKDGGYVSGRCLSNHSVTTIETSEDINNQLAYSAFAHGVFSGDETAPWIKCSTLVVEGNRYAPMKINYTGVNGEKRAAIVLATQDSNTTKEVS